MKKIILLAFVCLMSFAGCRQFGVLDLTCKINGYGDDAVLIIKNNETKSLTDVTITISPKNSGKEFYYNTEKITAKEKVRIPLIKFEDDGGNWFYGTIGYRGTGKITIECNQGRWVGDYNVK